MTESLRRPGYIALNTLREAVRQRILSLVVLLSLVIVLGAHALGDFHFGSSELTFIADLGLGAIAAFGAVLAVVMPAQLFFQEMEHHTAQTLLAKPVGRGEFIFGKLLTVAVILGGFCLLLSAVLALVLWRRETALLRELPQGMTSERSIHYAYLALTAVLQWCKLLVLASLTLLVATYARTQVFTIMLGFLLFVTGHFQHVAQSAGARAGASAVVRAIGWLARVLPDFELFHLAERGGGDAGVWDPFGRAVLYGLGYVAVAGILAVFSFRRREL